MLPDVLRRDSVTVTASKPRSRQLAWAIGVLTAAVLVLTADYQIYDNNLYSLPSATALLAGLHPYRDFFEWGVPLQVALSAVAQVLSGHRLAGEFVVQWTFIVAGVVMAFAAAVRLSRSAAVAFAVMLPIVLNMAATPTYHYPKLFVYPAVTLLAWAYMDRPGPRRAVALGLLTAAAFFFRHDHGIYVGTAVVLAFAVVAIQPSPWRLLVRDLAACALACVALVLPWAAVVAASEGLGPYVAARAQINSAWAVQTSVFLAPLEMNPVHALTPDVAAPGNGAIGRWLGRLPTRENAELWLYQVTVLVAELALALSLWQVFRERWRAQPLSRDTRELFVASALVAIVVRQLFREPSYFSLVAPLAGALGARLLAGAPRATSAARRPAAWRVVRVTFGGAVLAVTTMAIAGDVQESRVLRPTALLDQWPNTFRRLTASPPVDAILTRAEAAAVDRKQWMTLDSGRKSDLIVRYLHDCTTTGDHVFVSGQTPYPVSYYAKRPIAGGHLYWHDRWRADPERRAESLALLHRQSVPFAFATHNPVLEELRAYPEIHEYFSVNYLVIEGSEGRLLVDARRRPVRGYGQLGLPCFR